MLNSFIYLYLTHVNGKISPHGKKYYGKGVAQSGPRFRLAGGVPMPVSAPLEAASIEGADEEEDDDEAEEENEAG